MPGATGESDAGLDPIDFVFHRDRSVQAATNLSLPSDVPPTLAERLRGLLRKPEAGSSLQGTFILYAAPSLSGSRRFACQEDGSPGVRLSITP